MNECYNIMNHSCLNLLFNKKSAWFYVGKNKYRNKQVSGRRLVTLFLFLEKRLLEKIISFSKSTGPGLSFIVYPEALSLMPFPWVWCVFFFLMMITIGFGSLLSLGNLPVISDI
jgi:hypothetical protein